MGMDSGLTEEACRSLFGYLGKHPGPWWLSALRLKEAADTLSINCWPLERKHHDLEAATADFHIVPVYMLLMGMTVEAALKAIIVADKPNLVGPEGISTTLGNHHLTKLWNLAGLGRVRSRQRDSLLAHLENFVVVFGRYPVSKKASGMTRRRNSSFQSEPDFDRVNRLWHCLEEHAKKTVPELFSETTEVRQQPGVSRNTEARDGQAIPERSHTMKAQTASAEQNDERIT